MKKLLLITMSLCQNIQAMNNTFLTENNTSFNLVEYLQGLKNIDPIAQCIIINQLRTSEKTILPIGYESFKLSFHFPSPLIDCGPNHSTRYHWDFYPRQILNNSVSDSQLLLPEIKEKEQRITTKVEPNNYSIQKPAKPIVQKSSTKPLPLAIPEFKVPPKDSKFFKFEKGKQEILYKMSTSTQKTILIFFRRSLLKTEAIDFDEIYYSEFERLTPQQIFKDSVDLFLSNYEKKQSKPNSIIFANFSEDNLDFILEMLAKNEDYNETSRIFRNLINFRFYPGLDNSTEKIKDKLLLAIKNKLLKNAIRFTVNFGDGYDPKGLLSTSLIPVFNEINYTTMQNLEEFDMEIIQGFEKDYAEFLVEKLNSGILPSMHNLKKVSIIYKKAKPQFFDLFVQQIMQKLYTVTKTKPSKLKGVTKAVVINIDYKSIFKEVVNLQNLRPNPSKLFGDPFLNNLPWFLREVWMQFEYEQIDDYFVRGPDVKVKIYKNNKVRGNELEITIKPFDPIKQSPTDDDSSTELEDVD